MEALDKLLGPSLTRVEEILFATIHGDDSEERVNAMCLQIIKAGGKRIRPKLALLCGHLTPEFLISEESTEKLCTCAAAVELLHTATLIHDDVIDKASTRRGKPTLNDTEGNHAAVLAGDYMLARNFLLMQELKSFEVFRVAGQTTSNLVAGELIQLARKGDLSLTENDYRHTIYCKTGALFSLAASMFAILNEAKEEQISALTTFGTELGIAFQVTDDVLDYTSSEANLGKPVGEDLDDLRVTLPLIYALNALSNADKAVLSQAVRNNDFKAVKAYITKTEALTRCRYYAAQAANKAQQALEIFTDSPYRKTLVALCDQIVNRNY